MADVHDERTRNYNMSRIRSRDTTKPEMLGPTVDFPAPLEPVIINKVGFKSGKLELPFQYLSIKVVEYFNYPEIPAAGCGFSYFN